MTTEQKTYMMMGGVSMLLQVELIPRGTKRKPVFCGLSQQRHHYLTL